MHIDCETCRMRDTEACDDCVVTFLLQPGPVDIADAEREALANLAEAGLCPPLRLVVDPGRRRAG